MNYVKFEKHFSSERISKYVVATNNHKARTVMLYKMNMALSQAFMPLICLLEVTLRNNIDAVLSNKFKNGNWIISQKQGFMNDSRLQYIDKYTHKSTDNRYHLKQVENAEKKIRNEGRKITNGRIISEQTFGFWTSFYSKTIYKILQGAPIHAFSNRTLLCNRNIIFSELEQIRIFRNRISHHEPICFNTSNQIDFSHATSIYKSIINIIDWIDPEINSFLKEIDYVDITLRRMKKKYKKIR